MPVYEDVRKLTKEVLKNDGIGTVDVICGGFPCQPFSVAGKQRGKEDDRHLWPEMLRLIKEIRPTWVIGENVAGFITMALDDVLSDLEGEGYTCQAFVIPACAVGAIHRRDRVWIVAYADSKSESSKSIDDSTWERISANTDCTADGQQYQDESSRNNSEGNIFTLSDSTGIRQSRQRSHGKQVHTKKGEDRKTSDVKPNSKRHIRLPTETPVRHRDDGLPENMARLKALGNAVVPQIPEIIGRAIMRTVGEI